MNRSHMPRNSSGKRNPEAIEFARQQRKQSNDFASVMWQLLRGRRCRGRKFRREYPIPPYTVDFCCVELKLIVEVDGEDHFTAEGKEHDEKRDRFLRDRGYEVVRIPGYDLIDVEVDPIREIEAVIDRLVADRE